MKKELSFEEKYDLRLIQKNVRNVVIQVLWEYYRAEKLLELDNNDQLQAVVDQVMHKICVKKYGIQFLIENRAMLEQLAKENAIQVLNYVYKLKPVVDTKTKLTEFETQCFVRVDLKQIDIQRSQNQRGK